MSIHETRITDRQRDFQDITDLLTETYTRLGDVNMWSFCRFAGWTLFTAPEDLTQHLHLWRDNDAGLVGFAIVDGGRDTWVVVHPAHRAIEHEIYAWVDANWPAEGDLRVTYAEAGDRHRQAVLRELGYQEAQEAEYMHKYELSRVSLAYTLEPGFTIRDAAITGDYSERAALTHEVFHPGESLPEDYKPRVQTKPFYNAELDLAVYAPEGQPVAFATGWLNPANGSAEVEPVGTHAAYRQRGLAKAIVTEAFKRLADRGATTVLIASAPKPAVSNFLYDGLGPVSKLRFIRWVKSQGSA